VVEYLPNKCKTLNQTSASAPPQKKAVSYPEGKRQKALKLQKENNFNK
jgi:hypothetical protein